MKEATAEYNQPEIAWLQSGYVLSLSVCIPLHNFISHSRKRNNCQSIKVHVPMSVYQFNWIHLPIAENIFAVCFNYCTKWQLRDISNSDQCTNFEMGIQFINLFLFEFSAEFAICVNVVSGLYSWFYHFWPQWSSHSFPFTSFAHSAGDTLSTTNDYKSI